MSIDDWTEAERHFVMSFYGLSDLEPSEFKEVEGGQFDFGGLSIMHEQQQASSDDTTMEGLQQARALLSIIKDPLGLCDEAYQQQLKLNPALLSTTSELFDPKLYLARVHADTPTADLQKGLENLEQDVDTRQLAIKELVRQNFARFVTAKNSIDLVYEDMTQKGLADPDNPQFGTKRAREKLRDAHTKALKIFEPLVKRTEREADLKKRLEFVRKYKRTVFDVEAVLKQAFKTYDYASAVSDYRRGRDIIEEQRRTGNNEHYLALAKFWQGKVDPEARRLLTSVKERFLGAEAGWGDYQSVLGYIQLAGGLDPGVDYEQIWADDYAKRVFESLEEAMKTCQQSISELEQSWRQTENDAGSLTRCLLRLCRSKQHNQILKLDYLPVALWGERQVYFDNAAVLLGRSMSVLLASPRVNAGTFLESFFKQMTGHVMGLLDSKHENGQALVAFYGIHRALLSINVIVSKHPNCKTNTMNKMIYMLTKTLVKHAWSLTPKECGNVAKYEEWSIDTSDYSTALVRSLELTLLQYKDSTMKLLQMLQKTIGKAEQRDNPLIGAERHLTDCFQTFLTTIKDIIVESNEDLTIYNDQKDMPMKSRIALADVAASYKMLLGMANLGYLRQIALPAISKTYEDLFSYSVASTVEKHVVNLEQAIARSYLQGKLGRVCAVLDEGFEKQPVENHIQRDQPRPFVYKLLSYLTAVQTEIADVSRVLMRPLMGQLITGLFSYLLLIIRRHNHVTLPEYRQIDAEVAVLEEILATGMSEEASELSLAAHGALGQLLGRPEKTTRFVSTRSLLKQYSSFQYT